MSEKRLQYHELRLDEIRSKFNSDAPNFGLEHIDVHYLLSMASMPFVDDRDAVIIRLRAALLAVRKILDTQDVISLTKVIAVIDEALGEQK